MFRSSTTYARRFLLIAAAALGVLAATGCSNTTGDGRAAFPTNLDNPVHTRFESSHVANNFPATSAAFAPENHSAPGRFEHVFGVPR